MNERQTIDRGWFYVREPAVPDAKHVLDGQGQALTRRLHGYPARLQLLDESGADLPVATWLRAAAAVGFALEDLPEDPLSRPIRIVLGPAGTATALHLRDGVEVLCLDGPDIAQQPSAHALNARVKHLIAQSEAPPPPDPPPALDHATTRRVLFFESLMNSDMPHNDRELSQGVLHMVSSLAQTGSEVVLANVKMPIVGDDRPVIGLDSLESALDGEAIGLICITLLEGYWHGVLKLVSTLRSLGCNARIAVGGVMPTLTPEHVAAHLPDVSFVCRGAGEYFVPELCRILGNTPADTPLSAAQRHAFSQLDGLLVVDRPGKTLIAGNPAERVQVESLDAIVLDLSHLQARHIEGGIELSTSRGCIHKCSFCSIIGRERYSARTAEGVFSVMDRYQDRYRALYGDNIPHNAYRVHISDDDFCCDQPRALAFFRQLRDTPFRLSSVQVSVADLCVREDGRLLPKVHPDWLEAMHPSCFADHGRPIPNSDFFEDHKSRNWSSFLQIGVETFADRELVRLAKGYRVAHIRAVVSALARRQLHMDAYFIASNSDTSAQDFVDSLTELCRLKLRHPRYFHLRFPIVPHLVSYFPAATHRRKIRRGWRHTMALRGEAKVPGHSEFDYLFVDYDIPGDPWVEAAVDADLLTDEHRYTTSLVRLHACWTERLAHLEDGPERHRGQAVLRQLDDGPRRLVFEFLKAARDSNRPDFRGTPLSENTAIEAGTEFLGEPTTWLPQFARYAALDRPRLVLILDDSTAQARHLEQAVDLLLATHRDAAQLQLQVRETGHWQQVQRALDYALTQAKIRGIAVTVNVRASAPPPARLLAEISRGPLKIEVVAAHSQRPGPWGEVDAAAIPVHPVQSMAERALQALDAGWTRLHLELGDGTGSKDDAQAFATGLFTIGKQLKQRWRQGLPGTLLNLERPQATGHGGLTVLPSGAVVTNTTASVAHLDDLSSYDRCWIDADGAEFSYLNADFSRILDSFGEWLAS